jgi:hypothetical protein
VGLLHVLSACLDPKIRPPSSGLIPSGSHERAQCQPLTKLLQSAWIPSSPPLDKVQQA